MLNRWNYRDVEEPYPYADSELTYEKAIGFLDGEGVLEDWGCGTAYAKRFVRRARYVGVDGSPSKFNDVTADLREYTSEADYILLRHVLEHNLEWERVLDNALRSARKRLAVVTFTPFGAETKVIAWNPGFFEVPDISFRKEDLTARFPSFTEETFETRSQYWTETVFYISTG